MRAALYAIFSAIIVFSGQAKGSEWQDINGLNDATTTGTELGKKIALSLRGEGATVIALDVKGCQGTDPWCLAVEDAIGSSLLKSGVQFLPDDQRQQIRQQIMEEGAYQQSSMMVDTETAVEIGRQQAIQAFVSVSITGDETSRQLKCQSVNMTSGTVTFKHSATVERQRDVSTTHTGWLSAITWTTVGLGITAAGVVKYDHYNKEASENYKHYQAATNSDDATKYRKATEKSDTMKTAATSVGVIGLCVSLYGLTRLDSHETESGRFKLDLTSTHGGAAFRIALGF